MEAYFVGGMSPASSARRTRPKSSILITSDPSDRDAQRRLSGCKHIATIDDNRDKDKPTSCHKDDALEVTLCISLKSAP